MKAMLAVCVALASVSAQAEDMQKYLQNTQTLVRQAKYPAAI
jgi:hypothetical protein